MEQEVHVKLQPLDSESFRPYGQVLGLKSPVFPEVDGSHVLLMNRLKRGSRPGQVDQFAVHFSYSQSFLPLKGSMALVVAPPPRNPDAGPEKYELDYNKVAAFVMEPGDVVLIDRGTWHTVVPLGAECLMMSGTRKGSKQYSAEAGELEAGRIPVSYDPEAKKATPFIEYADVRKRDNRVIVLEL
jgi:ureidoglycolate hydrolase